MKILSFYRHNLKERNFFLLFEFVLTIGRDELICSSIIVLHWERCHFNFEAYKMKYTF